jgi:hypothetical protein
MRLARLALVFAALLSLACAAVRVSTDYDDTVDFTSFETYAWLDPPMREASRDEGGPSGDPFTQNTLVDKRVREEVDAWLTAHGYRQAGAEDEQVDFLIRYDLVSQPVTRDSPVIVTGGFGRYGYGYGVGSGVGYSPSNTYQEGTLILDVIDPGTQQLLWRGSGTSQSRDPHMKPERLHKSIGAILERFPPKPKAGSGS